MAGKKETTDMTNLSASKVRNPQEKKEEHKFDDIKIYDSSVQDDIKLNSPPSSDFSAVVGHQLTIPDDEAIPDDENLNPNLRKLVDAVEAGLHIQVVENRDTGDFDVFATASQPMDTTQTAEELQRQGVSATPRAIEKSNSSGWETVKTAFNKIGSKRVTNAGDLRLRPNTVVRATGEGLKAHHIAPIQIEYDRANQQRPHTPSIHSDGSELDCSSPSFLKSCETAIRAGGDLGEICRQIDSGDSNSESSMDHLVSKAKVFKWLEHVDVKELSPAEKANHAKMVRQMKETSDMLQSPPRKAFNVMRDNGDNPKHLQPSKKSTKTLKVLKDVSNVRRPGNVATNRVEISKSIEQKGQLDTQLVPKKATEFDETIPKEVFEAWGTAVPPSTVQFKRPTPASKLSQEKKKLQQEIQHQEEPLEPILTGYSTPEPKYLFSFETKSERRAHFEFALARLEGRVLPKTPSPVPRYVYPSGYYNDDVELERHSRMIRQPIPLRPKGFEAQYFEEVGEDFGLVVKTSDDEVVKNQEKCGECNMDDSKREKILDW